MADEQQLKILKKRGGKAWNLWRDRFNIKQPDFRGTDLSRADLRDADLRGAKLSIADLRGANLRGANLRDAGLRRADLRGADLTDANFTGADFRNAELTDAIFHNVTVSKDTQGLKSLSDYQRRGLIYVDEETEGAPAIDAPGDSELAKRQAQRWARARHGVHVIYGYAFILAPVKGLQLEDADEQSLIEEFQSAMEALRDELARQDDQIAALLDTVAALKDETVELKAELQDLRINAKAAAGLGKKCHDEFWLKLSGGLGTSVAVGVGVGITYVIGQFGGEIFDLLGGVGAEGPPVPPPEETVPV